MIAYAKKDTILSQKENEIVIAKNDARQLRNQGMSDKQTIEDLNKNIQFKENELIEKDKSISKLSNSLETTSKKCVFLEKEKITLNQKISSLQYKQQRDQKMVVEVLVEEDTRTPVIEENTIIVSVLDEDARSLPGDMHNGAMDRKCVSATKCSGNVLLKNKDKYAQCSNCNKYEHFNCFNLSNRKREMVVAGKIKFHCTPCIRLNPEWASALELPQIVLLDDLKKTVDGFKPEIDVAIKSALDTYENVSRDLVDANDKLKEGIKGIVAEKEIVKREYEVELKNTRDALINAESKCLKLDEQFRVSTI